MIDTNILKTINKLKELSISLENQIISSKLDMLKIKCLSNFLYCTLIGETSSGKSTYANSLIGEKILPETSTPTTGSIVKIYMSNNILNHNNKFSAVYKNYVREINYDEFVSLNLKGNIDLINLELEINTCKIISESICLIDTPGFNSTIKNHKIVLENYLPESDIILLIVNYRRGFTPQDKKYIDLLKSLIPNFNELLFVMVNYCAKQVKDKKILEIEKYLLNNFNYSKSLYILSSKNENGQIILTQNEILDELNNICNSESRQKIINNNTKQLLITIYKELIEDLDYLFKTIYSKENNIDTIKSRMNSLIETKESAMNIIKDYNHNMISVVKMNFIKFREKVINDVKYKIGEENRFTNIESTISFFKEHYINHNIQKVTTEIERELMTLTDRLSSKLEELSFDFEEKYDAFIHPEEEKWNKTKDFTLKKVSKYIAESGAYSYLKSLGGAAGHKSGIVNLAKKVVSKSGNIIGKKFKRELYDNMGRSLKKIGLNSSRAVAIWGVVITEVVVKLIQCATWKNKLIKQITEVSTDTISKLEQEIILDIKNYNNITTDLVNNNFSKRINVLNKLLSTTEIDLNEMKDSLNSYTLKVSEIDKLLFNEK